MGITIISIDTGIEVYNNITLQCYTGTCGACGTCRTSASETWMPGNDMFVQTHSRLRRHNGPTTIIHIIILNAMFFLLGFRFRIDLRAGYMSLFIVVGTLTKEASRINGSVAQDYFNDDHMFARQITSKINAIP